MSQLTEWMISFWKPNLGYYPKFILLSNHWLVFHFLSEIDLLRILESPRIFSKGVLMMKRWLTRFNPPREIFRKRNFWILLPDFPIKFWSISIFEAVANSMAKFVYFDETLLRIHKKRLVWLLFKLDLDRGLPDVIDITIGDIHFLQAVDFWKEPLCFHVCWKTRHLKSICMTTMVRSQSPDPSMKYFDPYIDSKAGPFNNNSFLGKMHLFFPSFFNNLFVDGA
jgi:hypothetical protein